MDWSKLSIPSGITKVVCELPGLNMDRNCVGRRRSEVDGGPRLPAERAKYGVLQPDQRKSCRDQSLRAARESFELAARLAPCRDPNKKCQQDLCGHKTDSHFEYRLR